jgi:hypothetical protein
MKLPWETLLSQYAYAYGHLRAGVSIGFLYGCSPLVLYRVPAGSYACEIWAFRAFGASLPVGATALQTAYLSMLCHIAGVRKLPLKSVPTPVLLKELNMTPIEIAWMRRVVRFWNLLAPFSTGHLFARVARGDCLLGVTTMLPTWACSVMKALRDIGYPYPIDAHSLHPVPSRRYFALVRRLCGTTLVGSPCFARRHVLSCVLTNAGFGALPTCPGRPCRFSPLLCPICGYPSVFV